MSRRTHGTTPIGDLLRGIETEEDGDADLKGFSFAVTVFRFESDRVEMETWTRCDRETGERLEYAFDVYSIPVVSNDRH